MAQSEVRVEAELEGDVANALLVIEACNVATHSVQVHMGKENFPGMHEGYKFKYRIYSIYFRYTLFLNQS